MDMKMRYMLENSDGSREDFNDISIESLGSHLFFGYVDKESVKNAVNFVLKANMLFTDNRDITIFLNTLGGYCYDGFALIDVMEISRLPVRTVGMGNIVSMGVFLLTAGAQGKRIITKNTQVMAHQHFGGVEAKFHELVANHHAEIYLHNQMMMHFLKHTKMTEKQIKEIMLGPTDHWLSPTECKKLGLVDHVVDELPDLFAGTDLTVQPLPVSFVSKRRSHQRTANTGSRKKR
jgi:ATP-dependent Clp protease protease subunit